MLRILAVVLLTGSMAQAETRSQLVMACECQVFNEDMVLIPGLTDSNPKVISPSRELALGVLENVSQAEVELCLGNSLGHPIDSCPRLFARVVGACMDKAKAEVSEKGSSHVLAETCSVSLETPSF